MSSIETLIKLIDKHDVYYELDDDGHFFIDIDDEWGDGIMYESSYQCLHLNGMFDKGKCPYKRLYMKLNDVEKREFIKYLEKRFNIVIEKIKTYD